MSAIATRYNRSNPCPVCGTGTKSCCATGDGFQLCRGSAGPGWRRLSEGPWKGYRHERDLAARDRPPADGWYADRPSRPKPAPLNPTVTKKKKKSPAGGTTDWKREAVARTAKLTPYLRTELARILKVPTEATLAVPYLGYTPEPAFLIDGEPVDPGHWTLPEFDGRGNFIGLQRRWRKEAVPDGRHQKRAAGSTNGLALPLGWRDNPGPLLCVEGWSDAIALAHCGLCAVGRPSNTDGADLLAELLADWPADRDVVVLGENDARPHPTKPGETLHPGADGVVAISGRLAPVLFRTVKTAFPPGPWKDVREYLADAAHWGDTPWKDRGLALLAHVAATASRVEPPDPSVPSVSGSDPGYSQAGSSSAESSSAKPAKPGPCVYTVTTDILDMAKPACSTCGSRFPIVNRDRETGRRWVGLFDCGSALRCESCRKQRTYDKLRQAFGYVLATSADPPAAERRQLCVAILPAAPSDTLRKKLNRYDAEFIWVETNDPEGCAELAAENATPATAPGGGTDEVSDFGHMRASTLPSANPDTRAATHPGASGFLCVGSVPAGKRLPPGFMPLTPAATCRALGNAFMTAPPPRPTETRYKRSDHSNGWKYDEYAEPSRAAVEGRTAYPAEAARQILEANGICKEAEFRPNGKVAPGYVIDAPPAVSAAASMVLRGVGTQGLFAKPDKDRATVVLGEWRAFLQGADLAGIGDGDAVQALLVRELWAGPAGRYDELVPRFLRADRHDRDVAEVAKEMDPHAKAAIDGVINSDWVLALVREAHELFEAGRRDAAAATKMRRTVVYEVRKRLEGCTDFVTTPLVPRILARLADQIRRVFKTCPKATPPGTKNTTTSRAGEAESQTVA